MSAPRTVAPRRTTVEGIKALRLYPHGTTAQLLNISSSGLLAESTAKIIVGSAVTVGFEGGFTPASVLGRVARCEVAVMEKDGLRYNIGIEFLKPIPLPEEPADAPAPAAAPPPTSSPASSLVRNRW